MAINVGLIDGTLFTISLLVQGQDAGLTVLPGMTRSIPMEKSRTS